VTSKSLLVAGVAILAASGIGCSTSSTSPGPQPPTPINATITDPTGDTCGTGVGQNNACSNGTATGTTIYDITGVTTSRTGPAGGTYSQIAVTVTFAQPVVLPAAGAAPDGPGADLVSELYFDTDGNFANGSNFAFCGPLGTYNGVDFAVNASNRLADGNYPINGPLPAVTVSGEATVAVNGNSVTFTVPISALGNNPAGPFNFGITVGNSQTPSDCAANAGYTAANFVEHPMSGTPRSGSTAVWGR
jgi:hypothetical protein